jgi:hypothetical protein
MQSTIHSTYSASYEKRAHQSSLWKKFINWTNRQEEYRFAWTAIILAGHGCIFTILTMIAIIFTGNHFIFWPFAIGAMAVCVVTNLAALPTRITIPVFFFSLLVDITIIILALANGFDAAHTYV